MTFWDWVTFLHVKVCNASRKLVIFWSDMSRVTTGFFLICCLMRGGDMNVIKWSLMSQTIDPDVMLGFLVLVKIWSIREIFPSKIRDAFVTVWMKPFSIAVSMKVTAGGLVSNLRRLIFESIITYDSVPVLDRFSRRFSKCSKNFFICSFGVWLGRDEGDL